MKKNKKVTATLLIAVLILILFNALSARIRYSESYDSLATVKWKTVEARSKASSFAKTVDKLEEGDVIVTTGYYSNPFFDLVFTDGVEPDSDNKWIQVELEDGTIAYVVSSAIYFE